MEPGYFFSDEPGYYEKGRFGIRLETVLVTIEKNDLPYGKWENILHTYIIGKYNISIPTGFTWKQYFII